MVVVLVEDKTDLLEILVDLVAVALLVDLHQELLVDLLHKHLLVVGLDMDLLVVTDKRDHIIEEEAAVVPDNLGVLVQINQEVDLVDMVFRHHHHLEIQQVVLEILELTEEAAHQLLVDIGLQVVVEQVLLLYMLVGNLLELAELEVVV